LSRAPFAGCSFTVKGSDLGLTSERANLDIDVRLGMQEQAGEPAATKKR